MKKHRNQKLLSLFLALLMLVLSMPFAAAEDSVGIGGQCGENVFWKLDDQGKLTVFGEGKMAFYFAVDGPDSEELYAKYYPNWNWRVYCDQIVEVEIQNGVTSIAEDAFYQFEKLQKVTLPDTLEEIEGAAFHDCCLLKSIDIPDSVKVIGQHAFANCHGLTDVSIPSGVQSIGDGAFESCTGLNAITVAADNKYYTSENGILFNKEKTVLIQCPATKVSVVIPPDVTAIGYAAFSGSRDLKRVSMPKNLTIIGGAAFDGCQKLEKVVIPDSVTGIGWSAFEKCDSLTEIRIPAGVTYIGNWAFDDCNSLLSIEVAADNPSYCSVDGVLYNKDKTELIQVPGAKTELQLPEGMTSLEGYGLFSNCDALTCVRIPETLTDIEDGVFDRCKSLAALDVASNNPKYTSEDGILFSKDKTTLLRCPAAKSTVSIPHSTTTIGSSAFSNCTLLKQVTIPNRVTSIEPDAFDGCALTSVTIPGSVKSIGDSAFHNCDRLETVVLENGVEIIGQWAFRDCDRLTEFSLPDTISEVGRYAFGENKRLLSIDVSSNNAKFSSIDGVLYNKDQTTVVQCPGAKREVILPETVTTIGCYAFRDCDQMRTVTIPNGVETIEAWAFYDCDNLTSIVLPNSVKNVGSGAFSCCLSLRSATVSNQMTKIGFKVFDGCSAMKRVTIPSSVSVVGDLAFDYCISLTDVYYTGSETEWEQIYISAGDEDGEVDPNNPNMPLMQAIKHFNWTPDTIEDQATSVSVLYSANTFNIENVFLHVEPIVTENEKARAWDIKPIDEDGNIVQPNQEIQIRLPLPEGWNRHSLLVTHTHDDGESEIIRDYEINGSYVMFWVSCFSMFSVTLQEDVPEHEHVYDDGVVTIEPTCVKEGEKIYTCEDGDDSYTEIIPATGKHIDENNDGKCDTCGEKMTGGKHCPQCGKIHNKGFIDKLTGFFHKIAYRLTHLFKR